MMNNIVSYICGACFHCGIYNYYYHWVYNEEYDTYVLYLLYRDGRETIVKGYKHLGECLNDCIRSNNYVKYC